MRWSNVLKFVLGVFIAIALLAVGGLIASRIMMVRFVSAPPKPMFPNDSKPTAPSPRSTSAAAKTQTDADKPAATTTPKPLPSGAYQARVTQQIGLIVRDSPSRDGASIGGVDFNERVTVLSTSPDGEWQKIRIGSDREGWVRTGNVEQLNQ